uniref:Putative secreted protein n=1 Tax=Ixodes ricinus TaxID=34613 RepID=A0A6B0UB25_IXORI
MMKKKVQSMLLFVLQFPLLRGDTTLNCIFFSKKCIFRTAEFWHVWITRNTLTKSCQCALTNNVKNNYSLYVGEVCCTAQHSSSTSEKS